MEACIWFTRLATFVLTEGDVRAETWRVPFSLVTTLLRSTDTFTLVEFPGGIEPEWSPEAVHG